MLMYLNSGFIVAVRALEKRLIKFQLIKMKIVFMNF